MWGPKIFHQEPRCPVPMGTYVRLYSLINQQVTEGKVTHQNPDSWANVVWYQVKEVGAMPGLKAIAKEPEKVLL